MDIPRRTLARDGNRMLRPVLAALVVLAGATPVLLSFAAADEPQAVTPESTGLTYSELHFDDAYLPGPTGWFAIPVTVDQPAYVLVEMDSYDWSSGGFTMAQGIIAIEGRESLPFMSIGGYNTPALLEVAHEGGSLVRCCDDIATSWSSGSGEGRMPLLLSPGETLWVGLAAYGWTDQHDVYFTLSAQALLSQGEPRSGDQVEAVDLFGEAIRAGTHVRALGYQVQPATGAAERTWTAERFGLFSVSAWTWGEGDGRLTVEVPGLEPRSTTISDHGVFAAAHRAGEFRVLLDELEGPAISQSGDWLQATALFADIDIPGDAAFIYP